MMNSLHFSPKYRTALYTTLGFLVGCLIDLISFLVEAWLRHSSILFSSFDRIELFSTAVSALLASLLGFLLARRDNHVIKQTIQIKELNDDLNQILTCSPLVKIVISPENNEILYLNEPAKIFMQLGLSLGHPFPLLAEWRQSEQQHLPIRLNDKLHYFSLFQTLVQWQGNTAVLLSLQDVTMQVELERIRTEVNRLLMHDIRSPICSIIGFVNLLLERQIFDDIDAECIKAVRDSAQKISDLVENISLMYKLESGEHDFSVEEVQCIDVAEKLCRRLAYQAAEKKVTLERVATTDNLNAYTCRFNRILFEIMLDNLLKNAIESSPKNATVTIIFAEDKKQLIFKVINSGSIPETIRNRFFEKYVTFGKQNGTGLGTYLCKLITKAGNGTISLVTEDEPPIVVITVTIPHMNC